jgi:hypothetical protein
MSQFIYCYAECLSCHLGERHYAECRFAECRYAECRGALIGIDIGTIAYAYCSDIINRSNL